MAIEDIIGMLQTPHYITPFELQAGQDELNQNKLISIARQKAIEDHDRLRGREGLVNRLYSENYNNPEQFKQAAARAGVGSVIPEYENQQRELQKEERLKIAQDLDAKLKQGEYVTRLMRGATAEDYDARVKHAEESVGRPIPALHFPYDKAKLDAVLQEGVSNMDAVRQKQIEYSQGLEEKKFSYNQKKDAQQMDIERQKASNQQQWQQKNFDQRDRAIDAATTNKAVGSEDERKAATWLSQADNAYKNLISVTEKYKGSDSPGALESLAPDGVKGAFQDTGRQLFDQASSSLSEAMLRAATGAGMNEFEAKQKIKELTPTYFDTEEVKKQKRDAIPVYLESLRTRAGRAAPSGYQVPQQPQGGLGGGATGGWGDDPFADFTPEEKALYLKQFGGR